MRSLDHVRERYLARKKLYTKKLLAQLESFVEAPMEDWGEAEFDKAFDVLANVDIELQACHYELPPDPTFSQPHCETTPDSIRKCILCGKETYGSVGKAGIQLPFICQSCRDDEDKALERRMDSWGRDMKKLVSGLDKFTEWLKSEDTDGC